MLHVEMLGTNRTLPTLRSLGPLTKLHGRALNYRKLQENRQTIIALYQQYLPAHMATHSIDIIDNSQNLCNFAFYVQQAEHLYDCFPQL